MGGLVGFVALALLASAPAAAGGKRVAVVVAAPDEDAAGAWQHALEEKLGAAGVATVGLDALAPRIGLPDTPPSPSSLAVRALLEQARKSYYDDRYSDVLASLLEAEKDPSLRVDDAVQIALWRASVFLAAGDSAGARKQARIALAMRPDLVPDARAFPPELPPLIDETRKTLALSPLSIHGLPAGAMVEVDERRAGATLSLPAGPHRVRVHGAGLEPVVRVVTLPDGGAATTIEIHPALALGSSLSASIAGALDGHSPSQAAAIARSADADVVLFVALAETPAKSARALLWWREDGRREVSARRAAVDDQRDAIASWVVSQLHAGLPSRRNVAWSLEVDAGIATWSEVSTFSQAGASLASTQRLGFGLAGFGPRFAALAGRGRWRAFGETSWANYAISRVRVAGVPGRDGSAGGGDEAMVRVLGGYAFDVGTPGETQWLTLTPMVGVFGNLRSQPDVAGLGVAGNWRDGAIEARLHARTQIPTARGVFEMQALGGIEIVDRWAESTNVHGNSVKDAHGFVIGGRVAWKGRGRWRAALDYEWDQRNVDFRGQAELPTDPAFVNGSLAIRTDRLTLSAGKAF